VRSIFVIGRFYARWFLYSIEVNNLMIVKVLLCHCSELKSMFNLRELSMQSNVLSECYESVNYVPVSRTFLGLDHTLKAFSR